jgi:V/A-type H+-transporting ATPase subunit I
LAIHKFYKITLVGHNKVKEEIISQLQKAGVIEITEVPENLKNISQIESEEKIIDINQRISNLNFAQDFINSFCQNKKIKIESENVIKLSYEEYIKKANNFNYKIIDNLKEKSVKLQDLNEKINFILTRLEELKNWSLLKINLKDLKLEKTKILFGSINKDKFEEFKNKLSELKFLQLDIVNEDEEKIYWYLIYKNEISEKLNEKLKEFLINIANLNDIETTVPEKINFYNKELNKLKKEVSKIEESIKDYIKFYNDILICLDYLKNLHQREEVKRKFFITNSTFLITGWIKEKDIKIIENLVKKYKVVDYKITVPEPDEEVPVELSNPRLIEPFEMVTKLFGPPSKKDIDPTPFIAPFFALFLALTIADAGYGFLLLSLSYLVYKKYKNNPGTAQLMKLLIICSFIAIFVGILTGGYFGIDFESLPSAFKKIKELREKLIILEPLKDPLKLFIFILALGVIQILTGFFIKFVNCIKYKEYYEAFTSPFAWIIIIAGIIFFILLKIKIFLILPVIGSLIILFFSDRSRNIIVRVLKGVYTLYGITGIFGDIVSYSRLFALALSSAVIASVINVIIGILYQFLIKFPYIGVVLSIIFSIIMFAFGHIFSLLIGTLGGFIHTTRLQFVEFFGKFYEGSGNEFKPLKEKFNYILIEK